MITHRYVVLQGIPILTSKTSLRGNKLKMEWPRAWKINPATVTDRRGGNDRPYEYQLDNGTRWISHDRLKKVYAG